MTEPTNGRVTMAVISSQLAYLATLMRENSIKLDAVKSWQDQHAWIDERIRGLGVCVDDLEDEVAAVQAKNNWWNGANTALSMIGGLLGMLFGGKKL